MEATIQKWGNSLAFRIPKSFADGVEIKLGTKVEIQMKKNSLILKPIKEKENRYNLTELLADITDENIHKEIDFGEPMGKEVW